MEKRLSDKIFFVINQIISATEIMFSRASLSQKLYETDMLFENENRYLNRYLERMEKQNLIKTRKKKGEIFYCLTKDGIKKLREFRLRNFFNTVQEWDGFWRVIVFDIPEDMRFFRDAFRKKMRSFNFFSLQKSVFVYPFECEKEISNLADFFKASGCVQIILAKYLGEKENEVRKFYGKALS
jgi:phenylacetic acid degradation operon negative regulatory protein